MPCMNNVRRRCAVLQHNKASLYIASRCDVIALQVSSLILATLKYKGGVAMSDAALSLAATARKASYHRKALY